MNRESDYLHHVNFRFIERTVLFRLLPGFSQPALWSPRLPVELQLEIGRLALWRSDGSVNLNYAAALRLVNRNWQEYMNLIVFSNVVIRKSHQFAAIYHSEANLVQHVNAIRLECIPSSALICNLRPPVAITQLQIDVDAIAGQHDFNFSLRTHDSSSHHNKFNEFLRDVIHFTVVIIKPLRIYLDHSPQHPNIHPNLRVSGRRYSSIVVNASLELELTVR